MHQISGLCLHSNPLTCELVEPDSKDLVCIFILQRAWGSSNPPRLPSTIFFIPI